MKRENKSGRFSLDDYIGTEERTERTEKKTVTTKITI